MNALGGRETILLVEDEPELLRITSRLLQRSGYQVVEAENGSQALNLCSQEKTKIDLIITDVIMPEMTGPEFITRLQGVVSKKAKVLFTSGYSAGTLAEFGSSDTTVAFLDKPYSSKDLLTKVREILSSDGT